MLFFFSAIFVLRTMERNQACAADSICLALVCSVVMLWRDQYSRPSKKVW